MTSLENILDFSSGEKFYRFGNADGKYWIMPAQGMHTAMNLYQPSGTKGRMVKSLLPYLHVLPPVRKIIHAQTLHCRLNITPWQAAFTLSFWEVVAIPTFHQDS